MLQLSTDISGVEEKAGKKLEELSDSIGKLEVEINKKLYQKIKPLTNTINKLDE